MHPTYFHFFDNSIYSSYLKILNIALFYWVLYDLEFGFCKYEYHYQHNIKGTQLLQCFSSYANDLKKKKKKKKKLKTLCDQVTSNYMWNYKEGVKRVRFPSWSSTRNIRFDRIIQKVYTVHSSLHKRNLRWKINFRSQFNPLSFLLFNDFYNLLPSFALLISKFWALPFWLSSAWLRFCF